MTTSKGGRRHKGDRELVATRVPASLARDVRTRATQLGLNINDYLAMLIVHDLVLRDGDGESS